MEFSPKLTEMIERNRSGAEPQAEISEGTAEDQAAIDALFDAVVEDADGDE